MTGFCMFRMTAMIIQTFSERSKGEKSFTYIYCIGGSSVPEWVCQRGSAGAQYTFCFREQLFLPGRGQPFSPLLQGRETAIDSFSADRY